VRQRQVKRAPQSALARSQFIPNRYTLVLSDPPVAGRFTSREALKTAQADTFRRQIETAQAQMKSELAARNFQVLGSVSVLQNAIFVAAPASRVAELQSIPGVVAVKQARKMRLLVNRAATLANVPAAWSSPLVGGESNAGAGIKIGVIDTGIDQTHPALQDSSLSLPPCSTPPCFPKGVISYTTNKVIVARSYVSMLTDTNPVDSLPDDFSPRDRIGHGTFNAVVAAGNSVSTQAASTTGGAITITGMAPKAWLGNYKVGGSPGVNEFASDQTLMLAVEDAVNDGMDVITCSIGSLAYSDAASDPVAAAFEKATQFAVVVAAAGDDGSSSYYQGYQYPGFNTISSPSNAPDVISVGATINSHVLLPTVSVNAAGAPSNLQGMSAAVGDSYFYPSSFGSNQAPLIDAATLGDGTACSALPAGYLAGSYALILRGNCTFDTKAANAQAAGAIGFIYYNNVAGAPVSPEDIYESGPSVMISNAAGLVLKSYVDANPGAMVTVDLNGAEEDLATWNLQPCVNPTYGPCPAFIPAIAANQLASYSSMGPTPDGQLKPDIVTVGGLDAGLVPDPNDYYLPAPGGMYSATQNYDPNWAYYFNGFSSNRFAAGDGTSFFDSAAGGRGGPVEAGAPEFAAHADQIAYGELRRADHYHRRFRLPGGRRMDGSGGPGCRRSHHRQYHGRALHRLIRHSELRHAADLKDHYPDEHLEGIGDAERVGIVLLSERLGRRAFRRYRCRKPGERDAGRGRDRGRDRHLDRDAFRIEAGGERILRQRGATATELQHQAQNSVHAAGRQRRGLQRARVRRRRGCSGCRRRSGRSAAYGWIRRSGDRQQRELLGFAGRVRDAQERLRRAGLLAREFHQQRGLPQRPVRLCLRGGGQRGRNRIAFGGLQCPESLGPHHRLLLV
jgi:subtilisin family serine protease